QGTQQEHDYLFWINTTGATSDTILDGDWKLIKEMDREKSDAAAGRRVYRPALYKLKDDPYEKNDLSADYPEKVAEMLKLIDEAKKPLP
ncbi:hypothetical protein P4B35_24270, partial [Pontiellaceae bacterium B12227]|nr:hypothetical protein [Pontiellaceae bacterium B12227]